MAIIEEHRYIPFVGKIKKERRWLSIFLFGIECTLKKKFTIFLLFVTWMSAIIQCILFLLLTQGQLDSDLVLIHGPRYFSKTLLRMIHLQIPWVAVVLALTGSGAISNDLAKGAHQIYFSRPITINDYLFGKFLLTFFYTFITLWLPLFIFWFYTFAFSGWGNSPNWRFVSKDIHVIRAIETILYLSLISISFGFLLLMISSLTTNAKFAGLVFVSIFIIGQILEEVISRSDPIYLLCYLSYLLNFRTVGNSLLELHHSLSATFDLCISALILLCVLLTSRIVLHYRLKQIVFTGV